jgi:hypothetical protein
MQKHDQDELARDGPSRRCGREREEREDPEIRCYGRETLSAGSGGVLAGGWRWWVACSNA